jgi:galactoside 2-L-fucosyltransferase 1/2
MLWEKVAANGFVTAPAEYIANAMNFYTKSIPTPIIFIICSDDHKWVKNNTVHWKFNNIFMSNYTDPIVDLAILTMCDHTIITSGSFGWWAGWLAGGMVVYFKGFPKPHTKLGNRFNHSDYYPPNWIGML